jgi:hypothetical protein
MDTHLRAEYTGQQKHVLVGSKVGMELSVLATAVDEMRDTIDHYLTQVIQYTETQTVSSSEEEEEEEEDRASKRSKPN